MCKKSTVISFVKVFEGLFLKLTGRAILSLKHLASTGCNKHSLIFFKIKYNFFSQRSKQAKRSDKRYVFLQISKLQYPVSYLSGTFVPSKGWFIFGGNNGFNQTQRLQTIDAAWTIGDPIFYYDFNFCTVQVMT